MAQTMVHLFYDPTVDVSDWVFAAVLAGTIFAAMPLAWLLWPPPRD